MGENLHAAGSCRRHGLNPFDCLKDLFTRLPAAKITQIKEFTPAAWAKIKAKEQVLVQAAYTGYWSGFLPPLQILHLVGLRCTVNTSR